MATLQNQQMNINPSQLKQLDGLLPTWMPMVWDWQDRAGKMDQLTLEDTMREAAFNKQHDPVRMQQAQANLESTLAGTANTQETMRGNRMKNDVYEANLPQQKAAEYKKLLKETSDNELAMHENEVYKLIQSNDPNQRKIGMQLMPYLKDVLAEKRRTDSQLRVVGATQAGQISLENLRHKNATALEQQRIDAGKYDRKTLAVTVESMLLKARDAAQKAEILEQAYWVAKSAGDEEAANTLAQRAQQARQRAAEDAKNRAAGAPGKIDMANETGMTPTARPTADAPIALPANAATAARKDRQADPLGIR